MLVGEQDAGEYVRQRLEAKEQLRVKVRAKAMIETRSEHQPSIEERKLEADIRLKEAELALRRDELAAQLERDKKGRWSPLATTVLVAVVGLLGTGLAELMQRKANMEVEKEKLQSSLILSVIETGNTDEAAKNLKFLIKTGLIRDESGSMSALLEQPESIPVLPAASGKESALTGPDILPSAVDLAAGDKVEFRCTSVTGRGRIRVTLDQERLLDEVMIGPLNLTLPNLSAGSHMFSWAQLSESQDFQSSCEIFVNGTVRFRQSKDLAKSPMTQSFVMLIQT